MSFLDKHGSDNNNKNPFAKKAKAPETKPVKLNADLHYVLKSVSALRDDGTNITQHINKAVEEYVEKYGLREYLKR